MLKRISVTLAFMLLAACHSNPYSDVKGNLDPKPPEAKPTPVNNFYVLLDAPAVDLNEGDVKQITVKGVVPKGSPILRYDNLPAFASVDATGTTITLRPQAGDAKDPKRPDEGSFSYQINIYLSSTDNPAISIPPQPLILIIHHVARGMTVTGFDSSANIDEGTNYSSTFDVQSGDYPAGPFTVSSRDLPVGMKITPTSIPTRFQITYSPPYSTVKTSNRTGYCGNRMCLAMTWHLTVVDPHGFAVSQDALWNVLDVRQNPIVVVPPTVTGLLPNADFYVTVEDPNGETIPQVTARVPAGLGAAALTNSTSSGGTSVNNPYVMMHVSWTGVPASARGTMQTLTLQSCVNNDVFSVNQCVTTPVNVQF